MFQPGDKLVAVSEHDVWEVEFVRETADQIWGNYRRIESWGIYVNEDIVHNTFLYKNIHEFITKASYELELKELRGTMCNYEYIPDEEIID